MTSNAMGDRGWKGDAVLIWDAAEMGARDLELMIGHSLIAGPPDDAGVWDFPSPIYDLLASPLSLIFRLVEMGWSSHGCHVLKMMEHHTLVLRWCTLIGSTCTCN
ncbi:hypothetical protein ACLOJK_004539 [Asimina triloba]